MSPYGEWSADAADPALNTPASSRATRRSSAASSRRTHFVIDTSRNGLGPVETADGRLRATHEDWCNPPDRGLGARPTTDDG